jgi:2-iminobutanoate/2-iminopropanoate deaminase
MVYVSSLGPVDPETGHLVGGDIKAQTRQCLQNLKAKLEAADSSLDKVVWANWSLRDPAESDIFNEEWARWFPGDTPIGQGTLLPPLQRRAGFRVSIGVIAEAFDGRASWAPAGGSRTLLRSRRHRRALAQRRAVPSPGSGERVSGRPVGAVASGQRLGDPGGVLRPLENVNTA